MTEPLHRVLQRQLRRLGLDPDAAPSAETWRKVLGRISQTYTRADTDRESLQRSMLLASTEMRELTASLEGRMEARGVALLRLTRAIHQSPGSVIISDPQGRITYVNAKFTEVTGYPLNEILGMAPAILRSGYHPDAFFDTILKTLESGRTWEGEICSRRKDGGLFWESVKVAPLRDDAGTITSFVAYREDIAERKRAEEALKRAHLEADAANRAKSAFLASMSHEIRTPMNAIMGFTQILLRNAGLKGTDLQNLDTILSSSQHLLAVINDILQMSRIESGQANTLPAVFDPTELLGGVVTMLAERASAKGLSLSLEVEGAQLLSADDGKLRQIVVNLVGNAIKFTETGVIRIRTVLDTHGGHPVLSISVSDTGRGIGAADRARLFLPFEQVGSSATHEGTGLGLAISRGHARLMGGDLHVDSQVGSGSTFTVTVPVTLAEPSEAGVLSADPAGAIVAIAGDGVPPPRVLVVDDSDANQRIVQQLLEPLGFHVTTADGGVEAIERFEHTRPDVILMDRRMPGMDGLATLRFIRTLPGGEQTPIIVLSASAFERDREEALEAGAVAFIKKPFMANRLLTALGDALDLRYLTTTSQASDVSSAGTLSLDPLSAADRRTLGAALELADLDQFCDALDRVHTLAPHSIAELRSLAANYRFDRLMAIFEVSI